MSTGTLAGRSRRSNACGGTERTVSTMPATMAAANATVRTRRHHDGRLCSVGRMVSVICAHPVTA
ncbi:hypothetical protein ACFQX7_00215 [Luedemannella flava]